jgi:serine/threonine protein kinase/tetratricopeptide (TPR) repeat protein
MSNVQICPNCRHENPSDTNFCGKCAASLTNKQDKSGMSFTKTLQTPSDTQAKSQPLSPKDSIPTGTTFAGRYQIIEELGRGGMGQVYKVLDTDINERIALKILLPGISEDSSTIERFSNELKIARQITHKNVCRVYHFGKDGDNHYITMEYVQGENLKSFIKRSGQLTVSKAVHIGLQICDGLNEAHKLGVIHRDLKPHNIIIDEEGNAKVMDFGIAQSVKTRGITGTGTVIGTPEYMSPEQAEGKQVDPRSDIYSLGVILFEMVTGTIPFDGETALSVAMKHKSEPPPQPKNLNENIPAPLNRLILKCLEKDKANRFQSVENLRTDLETMKTESPTTKRKIARTEALTSREITVKFSLKKLFKPAAAALVLLAAFFLVWQFILKKDSAPSRDTLPSVAVISFENETGDPSLDYLQKVIPNLLISSLEQSGNFQVATWERMYDLLRQMGKTDITYIDRESGFLVSESDGIDAIVLGSFTKAGDLYATDVKVLEVQTKKLIKSASSRGTGEDSILREQIDVLSRSISEGIGISERSGETTANQIADVTTSSLEAYNYYLEGMEAQEKFYVTEARTAFRKALELDPDFAIVYLYMTEVESGLGEFEKAEEHLKRAWALSKKATEKERLYIQAYYEAHLGEGRDKQIEILERIIEKYPKEKRAYYSLGLSIKQNERKDAIPYFTQALNLDPNYGLALNQLAYSYVYMKEFDKAIPYFRKYAGLYPEDANPLDSLGETYLWMGKLEESAASFMEALELKPDFMNSLRGGAYVYALQENYEKSFDLIQRFIDTAPSSSTKAEGHWFLGLLYHWLGNGNEALTEFRVVRELESFLENKRFTHQTFSFSKWIYLKRGEVEKGLKAHQDWIENFRDENGELDDYWDARQLNFLAFVDLEKGDLEGVRDKVDRMKEALPRITQSKARLNLYLMQLTGELLLNEGKYDQLIRECLEVLPANSIPWNNSYFLLPVPVDTLARTYIAKKDWDGAIAEYERMLTVDPSDPNDRFLIPPAIHYELAKLYEEKNWKGKAIEEYEKFLQITSCAGVSNPETESARNRLASLKGNT